MEFKYEKPIFEWFLCFFLCFAVLSFLSLFGGFSVFPLVLFLVHESVYMDLCWCFNFSVSTYFLFGFFFHFLMHNFGNDKNISICRAPRRHNTSTGRSFVNIFLCIFVLNWNGRNKNCQFHCINRQKNDRMINYDDSRRDISIDTIPGLRTQSRLIIREPQVQDSGNYTCSASNTEPASIYVFVSKGNYLL